MIIVTGAAGFIGSRLMYGLNARNRSDIIAVDDLTDGHKYKNLVSASFWDYLDYRDFIKKINENFSWEEKIDAIFHLGACSDTTEWNGRYMMENNYEYSKIILHFCLEQQIPLIYASSAAIYGANVQFDDTQWQQIPLNVYGYSKWQFDQYVKRIAPTQSIVGLRYFNVYGPHEQHKGKMASVAWHLLNQLIKDDEVKLFEGSHGYGPGEQRRDFIYVDDVVNINLWFMDHPKKHGIFNVGTGHSRSFNDIAKILIELHGRGKCHYVPFPPHLKNAYQSYTQANIQQLRSIGYLYPFTTLENGLKSYYDWFCKNYVSQPAPLES